MENDNTTKNNKMMDVQEKRFNGTENEKESTEMPVDNVMSPALTLEKQEDETHNVMDIVCYIYNRDMAEMASVNPLFFSELSKYTRVMNYLTNKSEKDHKEAYSFVQRGIKEGYFVPFLTIMLC